MYMYETTRNKGYSEANNNIQSDCAVAEISVMCARYTGGVLVGNNNNNKEQEKTTNPKPLLTVYPDLYVIWRP